MNLLLKNGAQPDLEDENGCTPLSRAIEGTSFSGIIEGENAAIVELLLAQGVKVDYRYKAASKFNQSTPD